MRVLHKILLNLIIAVTFCVLFYVFQTNESDSDNHFPATFENRSLTYADNSAVFKTVQNNNGRPPTLKIVTSLEIYSNATDVYNIWCIFTKVTSHAPMKNKFHTFTHSLVEHSTGHIALHIITDNSSKTIAEEVLDAVKEATQKDILVMYYDVSVLAEELQDVVSAMQPHFSSQPGTYYSDALFFLSLGLHRIALDQQRAAMFDADTKLCANVEELFQEFDRFGADTLFGLAPELTPVYRHVLYLYRSRHKDTRFGEPLSFHGGLGFPGLNSGVILFRLDRMRKSTLYNKLLSTQAVNALASKYSFKGHLGDQDFYTLLAMEHPSLVHLLPCAWNRQLCTWWRDHGYRDVFDAFAHCDGVVKLYHGNCNTPIPNN
ncbi:xyloside xylosyltransferase 1 [Periplaneta americana]|uniref:xyloside xylosyltransferase 1 n=1 Tax=Periplaneta americana TaxID=6978 RepID=UPI0037E79732